MARCLDAQGEVRRLYYQSEPWAGKPTRVFAYYAVPAGERVGKRPAMLLIHGGGGAAFKQWAELWAKRGYCALAMDLAGRGENRERLPDGGPDQDEKSKFDALEGSVTAAWPYHAVASCLRGVSFLAAQPEVDPEKIGVTGISWGGYLTCMVAGLDRRLKVAVPVYGCGYLHEDSAWLKVFARLPPPLREAWTQNFDPSQYLAQARLPMLFVNGTNDFAYPLGSYQKSYRLVPGPVTLSITVGMKHGHEAGWAPPEIGLFVDHVLAGGEPLLELGPVARTGRTVAFEVRGDRPLRSAELCYADTTEPTWQKRVWQKTPAKIEGRSITAELPPTGALVYFLTVKDDRQAIVSTPHDMAP